MRLSDDVLLEIFRYYLGPSSPFWPTLVHICCKWRRIVFASQQALHLRLFCAPGTPVLKTLDCWPALPIVMEYGESIAFGSQVPEDEVNVIAVLKQSHRVRSISLTVTTSLLDKLYAIKSPLLELEDLILLSRDRMMLTLPSTFLWGPRLRRLHLTRIASPALLQLLHSSRNLVDLQLHEALNHFSTEVLTDALSGMARLRSLSLHIPSTTNYVSPSSPPAQCVVLPALAHLKFRGISDFLEGLVPRIDAPRLRDIQVTVVDEFIFYLSRLRKFIDRIEMDKSLHQAHILSSERAIAISLTRPVVPMCFNFRLFSELSSEQLSAEFRSLPHFPAFFLDVKDLSISATRPSSQRDSCKWSGLINSFTGVKWLYLDGNESTNILRDFEIAYWWRQKPVLPALHKLYVPQLWSRHATLSKDIVSFMTSHWRSGYPIGLEYKCLSPISEPHGTGTSLVGTAPLPKLPPKY
jgi:hypothetical protein